MVKCFFQKNNKHDLRKEKTIHALEDESEILKAFHALQMQNQPGTNW